MSTRRLVPPALLLALAACGGGARSGDWAGTVTDSAGIPVVTNPAQGAWKDDEAWRVEEVASIGSIEADAEHQFGRISGVDVDADGNLYVADVQAADIRVFDASGAYLRTIGKPGAGPGEIGAALMGVWVVGDTVLAPDIGNQRVARFLRDGTFLDSKRLDLAKGVPARWDVAAGGRMVAQTRQLNLSDSTALPRGDVIVTLAEPGDPVDTLAVLPVGQSGQFVGGQPRIRIFAPEPVWDASPDGRLVTGMNDRWRFELWNADGSLARVFTFPSEPKPVTERDKRVVKEGFRARMMEQSGAPAAAIDQVLEQFQFADHFPTFALVVLGPNGSIWVQRYRSGDELAGEGESFEIEDLGSAEWGVFDAEGRYLGTVTFPGKYQPLRAEGDRFYGIARDELDVQSMKVYRVVMP